MDLYVFIIVIVLVSGVVVPLAKGAAHRLAKGTSRADTERLARLAGELETTEQRLSDAERRLQLAEERLDFQENLLAPRASRPRDEQ
ncbi:MAG TPA: hypothetical protein VK936_04330 [Longimicrobiales bacterium]|nr:hypothetical protein [Longimicrobiales bacterium]